MNTNPWRWILLTAVGLSMGVVLGLVLEDPIEAVLGMLLVTPAVTLIVGASLGAAQWLELRARVVRAGRWFAATALGLGTGLAVGVVAVEVVGEALMDQPIRLATAGPLGRAMAMLVAGFVGGALLGLAQYLVLRKDLPSTWPLLSAVGLGLGLSAGSLLAHFAVGELFSPAGVLVVVTVAGAVLGGVTARPLRAA